MPADSDIRQRRAEIARRLAEMEEVEVTVEKLIAGGDGLARWEGVPIFIPRSAPGDRVRVRLVDSRSDYGRAEIVEILEPGPRRREPPCPYFARCGGCDLQHLEDAYQVELKVAAVVETLRRLGGVELEKEPEVIAGAPWAYRSRAQLHTAPVESAAEGAAEGAGSVAVGYHARGSRELVPVETCPILVPELDRLLAALPAALAAAPGEPPRRLDLAAGDSELSIAPPVEGLPRGPISRTLDLGADLGGEPITYTYDARSFFQNHESATLDLVRCAVGPWEGDHAFDLFAGVGLFSLPLARRYGKVTAVEGDRVAVRYARNNARANQATNLDVVGQAVETWAAKLPENAARILVDPPRGGLPLLLRKALVEAHPQRLTYVSCHPATLARDLQRLLSIYRLESLTLLDLFPQTGHMEAVAQLALEVF